MLLTITPLVEVQKLAKLAGRTETHSHSPLSNQSWLFSGIFFTFSLLTWSCPHIMEGWQKTHGFIISCSTKRTSVQLHVILSACESFFFGVGWRRECQCHRLMSRFASQLLPALSSLLLMPLWKNGCLRAAARVRRFDGSYSSMASIRSNSWWCSSASDRRYRRKGLQFSLTYLPAEEFSSQSRRPR